MTRFIDNKTHYTAVTRKCEITYSFTRNIMLFFLAKLARNIILDGSDFKHYYLSHGSEVLYLLSKEYTNPNIYIPVIPRYFTCTSSI